MILGEVTLQHLSVNRIGRIPRLFPARSHNFIGAFPLAVIAFTYIIYQSARRPASMKFAKAIMLAVNWSKFSYYSLARKRA